MISSRKLVIGDVRILPRATSFEEVGIVEASVVAVDGVTLVAKNE